MYYKLSTWKRRHSRGQFLESNLPPTTPTYNHHTAHLVHSDRMIQLKQMSDILLFFSLLRYPNITTRTKLKGSF